MHLGGAYFVNFVNFAHMFCNWLQLSTYLKKIMMMMMIGGSTNDCMTVT